MKTIAAAILALATLATTGCAAMGTKRSPGAQIQRTAEPDTIHTQEVDARPELGQR